MVPRDSSALFFTPNKYKVQEKNRLEFEEFELSLNGKEPQNYIYKKDDKNQKGKTLRGRKDLFLEQTR